ncbi:hypothetical protein EU528_01900 [Candidatus Thorarchaeota archaeon]|nr:MAG: hypothetical protein EU528_01900 [Candidatus Thorarchaeota archaeon]
MSDEQDRIVVRKDTIARCAWCGSPESNKWISTPDDDIYCTIECMEAATMGKRKLAAGAYICCAVAMMLLPVIGLATSNYFLVAAGMQFLMAAFAMFICGFVMYFSANEGKKYQERKGKYRGISPIECEYCMHSNPPSATRCLNCDATLTRAPFVSEAIPPWFHKYKKIKGIRCPHCNAVYSYIGSQISDEGYAACQNCNKQIFVATRSTGPSSDLMRAHY